MYQPKLTIGVLPTRRAMLDLNTAVAEKERVMKIISEIHRDIVTLVDVEDVCNSGIIESDAYAPAVVEKFSRAHVDGLFVPFCDFGDEGGVADVASKLGVPVLVWGARDQQPNSATHRGRDTQCGMFAATKVLRRNGVKYSYIFNVEPETEEFRQGFDRFVRVVCVLKDLKTLRIGKVGERPGPFRSVMTNEARLMKRFGIQTVAISPAVLQLTMNKILEARGEAFEKEVQELSNRFDCTGVKENGLDKMVAMKKAMQKLLSDNRCTAAAIECWPACALMGMPVCAVVGELTDIGIPVSCETDINGAITMVILRACMLGKEPEFLADLTIRHPENDNGELLWHCGPFAYSLKAENSTAKLVGGQEQFELKQGDLTLCRFDDDEDGYYLFAGEATTTTGPETTGTYVWMQTDNWKAWEEKLMFGPYIHHLGGVYGKLQDVLREVARYLDVKFDYVGADGPRCL